MRRRLMVTVAAAVSMVLLAMLVPTAVLMRDLAREDLLARAALEVQATETVVASGGRGAVAAYLERVNDGGGIRTTVLYPDGDAVGPDPGEDRRVLQSRSSGLARVDDVDAGTQILVPVSLGASTAAAPETPVVRVLVTGPGLDRRLVVGWSALLALGLVLLAGALVVADRIGRSITTPLGRLAAYANRLGRPVEGRATALPDPIDPDGPEEVRELGVTMNTLVGRIGTLLEREREQNSDVSHRLRTPMTALRLRIDALADAEERARLSEELDGLQATVDRIVAEARRSEREGLVAAADARAVVVERVDYWSSLAEDQQRPFELDDRSGGAPLLVRAAPADLAAALDVLLDNVFAHTPDGVAARVVLEAGAGDTGAVVTVEDAGPGLPDGVAVLDRGTSAAGSTGLGLSIAERTTAESGGRLVLARSGLGGAAVRMELGGA